jgi:probable rRNA maturation factor
MSAFTVELQVDDAFAALVDAAQLRQAALATLRQQSVTGAVELSIVVTSDEALRRLNRDYRGVDAPTDVLSFGNADDASFVIAPEIPRYLGDVLISFPRAEAQAAQAGNPLGDELRLLVVHGVLHLLGHDHAEPDEKTVMWAAQKEILGSGEVGSGEVGN